MEFTSIEFIDWDTDKIEEYSKKLESIFQNNEDMNKTAYMNWRLDAHQDSRRRFVIMGEAYFSTAHALIQMCLEDNTDKKADIWIFPIMFNIVHGIEVYLKAINAVLNLVLNKPRTNIEGGHDIKQLCNISKKLIIEYRDATVNSTTKDMFTSIKVLERFITNIYEKTGDMTFARYPMAKDKTDHFYVQALKNEVIDLEILEDQVVIVYKLLEYMFEMPELDLEVHAEMMADYVDAW